MSNNINTEKEVKEVQRGSRGKVGRATPKKIIVQLWHKMYFTRKNAKDKNNPNKRIWVPNLDKISLKEFARRLLKSSDDAAKNAAKKWFTNKSRKRMKKS